MDIELQGQIERITYRNEENHYTIARLRVQGEKNPVTVVGNLVSVSPGEVLRLTGAWERHPRYGEQFKVTSYESVVPATVKGIERYLGSGLIKGIGPVTAKRLVEKFGTATLDIIETDILRLQDVEGIGSKRIGMIQAAWEQQKEVRNVMLFLQGHEVSSSYAAKIYRHYGKESLRVVRENPYKLSEDIFGIGFLTADKIATKLGIPKDAAMRAEAGIMYVLQKLADEGHVYYPLEPLVEECRNILDVEAVAVGTAVKKMEGEKKIVVEDDAVYLTGYFTAEVGIAHAMTALLEAPKDLTRYDSEEAIQQVQKELQIALAENQKTAVKAALEKKGVVITGGPGTGKTTIIKAILRIYEQIGYRALLAAPTGRAAKRMSEAAAHEAKTIHRLLEFSPRTAEFKRNEQSPLEADLVVIDEASMVDTLLMHHFIRAVPRTATLIIVGDIDQLPSVGAGNVLRDIIDSGAIPTVRLNEIFRQSQQSLIIVNAHKINHGEFPVITGVAGKTQDFYFIEVEEPEEACRKIIELCSEKIPARFGFDPVVDIQVLAPMHRGLIGASNLNIELQRTLNPSTVELVRGGKILKAGDKVMQIRNNYDKDVYNGDIGRVASIDREEQELSVDYDGRRVSYDFTELDELVLAFAVSVHKSQGSEYPVVVLPLLTQHYLMLQRNLLYTAVTRGKKLVVIVGTKKALAIAIKNDRPRFRYTRLRERLRAAMQGDRPKEFNHPEG
jgi:exodeoxyribonuclease V alpha subunit